MKKELKKREAGLLKCRIHTRVTQNKYDELCSLLADTHGLGSLSELVRNILNNREIILRRYDVTFDRVMEELSLIRKELNAIGVNINQITHRFHEEDLPEGKLFQALEIAKLYQQTDEKISELLSVIAKTSELWLPK